MIDFLQNPAGFCQNPLSDGSNQAAFFCQRNKSGRRNPTVLGTVPAQQRFKSVQLLIVQADFRLIMQSHFVSFQRPAQIVCQEHRFIGFFLKAGFIKSPIVATAIFGRIHGPIRIFQDIIHCIAIRRIHHDSHARRHRYLRIANDKIFTQNIQQCFGDFCDFGPVCSARQHHNKFIAANPGFKNVLPHNFADAAAGIKNQFVTDGVSKSVIYHFQFIQIDEEQTSLGLAVASLAHLVLKPEIQTDSVRHSG